MDGDLVPSGIYDLLDLLAANLEANPRANRVLVVRRVIDGAMRHIATYNPRDRARRNVAHHYDLNGRLYSLFLDRDRQYSCAYFPRGDETLEEAQAAKKRHIAAKLCLDRPDLKVLDIGWAGVAWRSPWHRSRTTQAARPRSSQPRSVASRRSRRSSHHRPRRYPRIPAPRHHGPSQLLPGIPDPSAIVHAEMV